MKNILGLALGLVLGYATTTYAQTVYMPDLNNAVCWDQIGTLATINAWKVRVTYNTQPPVSIAHTCSGAISPYQCQLNTAVPMSLQTGTLNVKLEAAAVNPDGSLTAYSTLLASNLTFGTPAPVPPAGSGSNLRIIKLLQAIANFLKNLFNGLG